MSDRTRKRNSDTNGKLHIIHSDNRNRNRNRNRNISQEEKDIVVI